MRKVVSLLLALMVMFTIAVTPVKAQALQPQDVFEINMVVRVYQTQINGSLTWAGAFNVYVKLVNPVYRGYFNELAKENKTRAEREFHNFVYNLIYDNLKNDFNSKLEGTNLTAVVYVPPAGPVRVLQNWSAVVSFSLVPFFVPQGHYLTCPFYGPYEFVFNGKVYGFYWERLTLILPQGYEIYSLAPKPSDMSGNVAIWENGDYLPIIQVYNPVYLFDIFINTTQKSISLAFDPDQGYVQFNATFVGMNATQPVIDLLLDAFRSRMKVLSISAKRVKNGVEVIGVVSPKVAYKDTRTEKIWIVLVKLPGSFNRIEVKGGTYQIGPDGTLVMTFKEKKTDYLPYVGIAVGGLAVLGFFLWRRRSKGRSETMGEGEPSEPSEGEGENPPEGEEDEP